MTTPSEEELDALERDIVIDLTNAYYEHYRYDRPNDSVAELTAFAHDLATNDLDELLTAHTKATRKQVIAEARKKMSGYWLVDPKYRGLAASGTENSTSYFTALGHDKALDQINKTLDEMEAEDA